MSTIETGKNKQLTLIWVLSVVIPVAVAVLLFMPTKLAVSGQWVRNLPHLNAILNSAASVSLMVGLIFIKKKNIAYHRLSMLTAFVLGALFLVSYVIYHASVPSTPFGDTNFDGVASDVEKAAVGGLRLVYLIILLTHILLAIIVVPFVLLALYHAVNKNFEKHKKITRFAYPIWLYVTVSGVLVYILISPYYPPM